MASGANVGTAYISIIPEMHGIQGKIAKQLGADIIGKDAGKKLGEALVASSTKSSSDLMKSFSSVGDRIAYKTKTSLSTAFDNVAKSASSKMSGLASTIGAKFSAVGKAIGSTGIGKALTAAVSAGAGAFTALTAKAKGAAQFAAEAFSGIGNKIGEFFSPLISKVTPIFGKLGSIAKSAFSKVASIAKVGAAAVAAGVSAVFVTSIKGFAEYEQLAGGAKAIFDEMDYSKIAKDAQNAYKTMGMSANEYLTSINQVGAAFASTMGDERGYNTAKQGMQAISDYASGTGRSVSELNEKYQMITRSTSSYQSIADQFSGILPATSSAFLEQAQAAGLLSGEYTSLTEVPLAEYQEAVTGMLGRGVDALNLTGNTAREATETISGSISMLRGSWSNFLADLGRDDADIKQSVSNLVDSAIAVFQNLVPRAVQVVGALFSALPAAIAQHGPRLMAAMTQVLDGATNGAFSQFIGFVSPYVQRLGDAFSHIAQALAPVAQAIGEFGATVAPILAEGFTAAVEAMQPVADFLGETLPPIIDWIGDRIQQLADLVSQAFDGIGKAADNVSSFLQDPLGSIGKLFTGTGKQAQSTEKTVSKSFSGMGRSVANSSKSITSSTRNTSSSVSKDFSSMSSDVTNKSSTAQKNATNSFARLGSTASSSVSNLKTSASSSMKSLASNVSSSAEKARADATNKFGTMATGISSKTLTAKNSATSNFEAMRTGISSKSEAARQDAINKFGTMATGISSKTLAAKSSASNNFASLRNSVASSTTSAANTAVSKANQIAKAWNKKHTMTITANATGNAINGAAAGAAKYARDAINSLRSKTVTAQVNGNATWGSTASNIWSVSGAIGSLAGKTVDVVTNYVKRYIEQNFAAGGLRYHADGMILNRATWIGGRDIAGEAGAEAIIPLTNRRYVAPFAETVADFINQPSSNGGVTVTGNTFVVRNDRDIPQIARAINRDAERQRRAAL